jgi:hypothetical protein
MKKIVLLSMLVAGAWYGANAQQPTVVITPEPDRMSEIPQTHIQVSNEMYQNHSQFYNKDNRIDPSKTYMTGNGTYWVPGYSNSANRNMHTQNGLAPNTSVNPQGAGPVNTYIQENLRTNTSTVIIPRQVIIRR